MGLRTVTTSPGARCPRARTAAPRVPPARWSSTRATSPLGRAVASCSRTRCGSRIRPSTASSTRASSASTAGTTLIATRLADGVGRRPHGTGATLTDRLEDVVAGHAGSGVVHDPVAAGIPASIAFSEVSITSSWPRSPQPPRGFPQGPTVRLGSAPCLPTSPRSWPPRVATAPPAAPTSSSTRSSTTPSSSPASAGEHRGSRSSARPAATSASSTTTSTRPDASPGSSISTLDLFPMPNHDDVPAYLLEQDVVWVNGGSVANLLAVWARPRPRTGHARGLGGGCRPLRRLGRVDLLVRRRHDRLLRPRAAGRHQRPRPAPLRQRRALRLGGATPTARPPARRRRDAARRPTAPTTGSASSTTAPSSSRRSPSATARAPTSSPATGTGPSRSGSSRAGSPTPDGSAEAVCGLLQPFPVGLPVVGDHRRGGWTRPGASRRRRRRARARCPCGPACRLVSAIMWTRSHCSGDVHAARSPHHGTVPVSSRSSSSMTASACAATRAVEVEDRLARLVGASPTCRRCPRACRPSSRRTTAACRAPGDRGSRRSSRPRRPARCLTTPRRLVPGRGRAGGARRGRTGRRASRATASRARPR